MINAESKTISPARFRELTENLPVMIEFINNNEVINEFYNLIEADFMGMPKECMGFAEL
jgi:PII-like signaling protein